MRSKSPAFVALLTGALIQILGCNDTRESTLPLRQDITESVYASATVQPDSMYRVHAAVTGILRENLVSEGQQVVEGAAILHITDRSPELSMQNARLQMDLAEANYNGEATPLRDLRARIANARLTAADDSVNFVRQQKLWSQKIGSKAEFENRKLAFERSRNQLAQLMSEYERLSNELRTQMIQARNAYESSRASADEFTVRSTMAGKVYALYKEPGELVSPNEPLATIGKTDSFILELLVDEVDIVRVRAGQQVLVTLDAYDEQVFRAHLTKIFPQKDERNQVFLVEARFEEPPETLYPGLSGEASIVIARRQNALVIPREYLLGKDSVLTADGPRKITPGLQTLDRVEVLSGLDPETPILKPDR